MVINGELIDKLANLSMLSFSPDEKDEIRIKLAEMLEFVNKLNELDCADAAPLLHISSNKNITREDVMADAMDVADVLKNTGNTNNPFFKVPKVIHK